MRQVIFGLMASLMLGGLANANTPDVYSYKDASGVTHYTDRWRPGAVLVKAGSATPGRSAPPPATTATSSTAPQPSNAQRIQDNLNQAAATREMQADLAKKRAEQCKQATDRYNSQIAARRLFKKDDKGNQVFYSDAEADALRVKSRQERDALCGPGR
jgi:Domain of unknown function (DUF4124)